MSQLGGQNKDPWFPNFGAGVPTLSTDYDRPYVDTNTNILYIFSSAANTCSADAPLLTRSRRLGSSLERAVRFPP